MAITTSQHDSAQINIDSHGHPDLGKSVFGEPRSSADIAKVLEGRSVNPSPPSAASMLEEIMPHLPTLRRLLQLTSDNVPVTYRNGSWIVDRSRLDENQATEGVSVRPWVVFHLTRPSAEHLPLSAEGRKGFSFSDRMVGIAHAQLTLVHGREDIQVEDFSQIVDGVFLARTYDAASVVAPSDNDIERTLNQLPLTKRSSK